MKDTNMKHKLVLICLAMVITAVFNHSLFAEMDQAESKSPRVLMLLADGFNHSEYAWPYGALRAVGYEVDVASFNKGTVETGNKGRENAEANLTFDEVKVDDYFALMIPGGKSPAKLVESKEVLDITRAFVEKDKPVGAICHGPLVLMEAGLLRDRSGTALWSVKDEKPELWTGGAIGNYLDQPVVLDGNIMTGRHVADVYLFVPRFLAFLEAEGGLALPSRVTKPLVIYPGATGHLKWEWGQMMTSARMETILATKQDELTDDVMKQDFDALAIFGEAEDIAKVLTRDSAKQLIDKASKGNKPIVLSPGGHALLKSWDILPEQVVITDGREEVKMAAVFARMRDIANAEKKTNDSTQAANGAKAQLLAVIVIEPGFDDRVALATKAILEYRDFEVVYAAKDAGWVTGISGVRVDAHSWDAQAVAKAKLFVGPGMVWPEDKEPQESDRAKWLLKRYSEGATLLVFGRDSVAVGRDPQFKGSKFASSGQALWNFGKTGGKFTREDAVVSTDRLVSGSGADAVAEAIKLLDPMLKPAEGQTKPDGKAD